MHIAQAIIFFGKLWKTFLEKIFFEMKINSSERKNKSAQKSFSYLQTFLRAFIFSFPTSSSLNTLPENYFIAR